MQIWLLIVVCYQRPPKVSTGDPKWSNTAKTESALDRISFLQFLTWLSAEHSSFTLLSVQQTDQVSKNVKLYVKNILELNSFGDFASILDCGLPATAASWPGSKALVSIMLTFLMFRSVAFWMFRPVHCQKNRVILVLCRTFVGMPFCPFIWLFQLLPPPW